MVDLELAEVIALIMSSCITASTAWFTVPLKKEIITIHLVLLNDISHPFIKRFSFAEM